MPIEQGLRAATHASKEEGKRGPEMGNTIDTILSCGNQNDALAARDKELEDIRAQADDFRLQAERYKRQLDEATWALSKQGNGGIPSNLSKASLAESNKNGKVEPQSNTKGIAKSISFKTDQSTPTNSGKDTGKESSKTENKKRILNPSLFSYNPSGRI